MPLDTELESRAAKVREASAYYASAREQASRLESEYKAAAKEATAARDALEKARHDLLNYASQQVYA